MKTTSKTLCVLIPAIILLAGFASIMGLFYKDGNGSYEVTSLHGKLVTISGEGLYKDMPADVAIQGQAQDVVTLLIAIPFLLLISFVNYKNTIRKNLMLAGVLGYFLVTYTFYLSMAAYNILFLVYAALMGLSFFAFYNAIKIIDRQALFAVLGSIRPAFPGWVLIVIPLMIGSLWLNIVVPPLIDGSIYPASLLNFTTLIVQGNDLGLALPLSFVLGILYLKRKDDGILYGPVYLVFLCFLMLALVAKVIGMGTTGVAVGPPLVIIPTFFLISLLSAGMILRKVR